MNTAEQWSGASQTHGKGGCIWMDLEMESMDGALGVNI